MNRILNVYNHDLPPPALGNPSAPEPLPEGAQLEAQIAAPKPPTDADPQTASAVALGPLLK